MRNLLVRWHGGMSLIMAILVQRAHTEHPSITWSSPSDGENFVSGDTIKAKWTSQQSVVSPSFRLCSCDKTASGPTTSDNSTLSSSCGSMVWPDIAQSAGSSSISLTVPNVTTNECYFLQMEDDFGDTMQSPSFYLNPTGAPATGANSQDTTSANAANTPAPLADNSPVQQPFANPVGAIDPKPSSNLRPSSVSAALPQLPSASLPSPQPPPVAPSLPLSALPNILTSRTPPPTAAFAVPLSLVGTILLAASVLFFRHRRQMNNERARDAEKLSRRSSFHSFKSSTSSEVENALDVLSRNDIGYGVAPVPLFMPRDSRQEPRRSTREAYRIHGHSSDNDPPMYRASSRPHRSLRSSTSQPTSRSHPPTISMDRLHPGHYDDGAVTHTVISDYMQPSPVPPSSLLSVPQKLHTRSEATQFPSINDKPLPASPRAPVARNVYDAVADAVRR